MASSSSTATLGRKPIARRTVTNESESSTSPSTAAASPAETPRHSASNTSLSSLASLESEAPKQDLGTLIDTYGNRFEVPDFTIKQIHDAIPKHCFKRSALRGYGYILRDIAVLATVFYVFHNYVTPETVPSKPARVALWGLYTFLQGLWGTGLWVIAHECGHGAFSDYKLLNNFTGWVLHSALLVPFFSWQISHSKHHKATGHMHRDMVFVPRTREMHASRVGKLASDLADAMEETPIYTFVMLVMQQIGGWPNYLLANVTGHNYHENQREGRGKGKKNGFFTGVNHFNPSSPLYENKDAKLILLSDLGLGLSIAALVKLGNTFGWANLAVWYFIPYLWVHHWLVAITFLQHTDPAIPHYMPEQWNFVRGAAATIDREFGFIGRHIFHGIIETHVLHHYVSSIPFYNADEATEAIIPIMGKHYKADTKGGPVGFIRAFWRSSRMCQWVEPSAGAKGEGQGILFFRNSNGLGPKPLNKEQYEALSR